MSGYFTSIEIENGSFIGIVYNANTNAEVYRTKPYGSQAKATEDANNYTLRNGITQTVTNTIEFVPAPSAPRRCCGG